MLQKVTTIDYQSIAESSLELAPFTVIVGPSNSGKSATLRSIRTLVYNAVSPSFVRAGQKAVQVDLDLGDCRVAIERGPALSTYRIFRGTDEQVYTKAGTSVPAPVAAVLQMPQLEGQSLNFSFQFDRPFLLDSPGSTVAKVLGDLTNVTVIYDAAREANRRRLEVSGKLRVRHEDERELEEHLQQFRDLKAEAAEIKEAETRLAALWETGAKHSRLGTAIQTVDVLTARLKEAAQVSLPVVDVSGLEAVSGRVVALRSLLKEINQQSGYVAQAKAQIKQAQAYIKQAEKDLAAALAEAGVCPLCGQVTT